MVPGQDRRRTLRTAGGGRSRHRNDLPAFPGLGIVYVSHKLEEIKTIGDRITVLRDGNNVATLDAKTAELNEIIRLMIGASRVTESRQYSQPREKILFSVDQLRNKHFRQPFDLSVYEHEIVGITGLVGAGKTEPTRVLFGADARSGGEIRFAGITLPHQRPRGTVKHGLGYVPEDRDSKGLCLNLTVAALNGLFITRLRVPPFIATLGMLGMARGLALILSRGIPIFGLSKDYLWIGQGKIFNVIPVPTIILLAVYTFVFLIARYTRFGRLVYATGSNAEAAELSGINLSYVFLGTYALSGLFCGVGAVIEAARLGTVQPAGGNGYELLAIGAVVIGT